MTSATGGGSLRRPLLTGAEVAAVLRVSNRTVFRVIQASELAALRLGNNYRIREPELEAFLNAGLIETEEVGG